MTRVAELARTLDEMRAKIALLHSELDAVSAQAPRLHRCICIKSCIGAML